MTRKGSMALRESGEMYLETIYVLSQKKACVRASDVSTEMRVTLTRCFVALGVDREIAAIDACRVEHIISDECFAALKTHFTVTGDETARLVMAR